MEHKKRSVFSLTNFRGLDSENKKSKVEFYRATEGKNFMIDSGVLKTRYGLEFVKTFGAVTSNKLIDFFVKDNFEIVFTDKDILIYNTIDKTTISLLNDNKVIKNLGNRPYNPEGRKPILREEKDAIFIFGLRRIYVLSFYIEKRRLKYIAFYDLELGKKKETFLTEEEQTWYDNLPKIYEPTLTIGNNILDDVNLLSKVSKYRLFAHDNSKPVESYNVLKLPTHYDPKKHGDFQDLIVNIDFYKDSFDIYKSYIVGEEKDNVGFPVFLGIDGYNYFSNEIGYGDIINENNAFEIKDKFYVAQDFEYILYHVDKEEPDPSEYNYTIGEGDKIKYFNSEVSKNQIDITANDFFQMTYEKTDDDKKSVISVFEHLMEVISDKDVFDENYRIRYKIPFRAKAIYKDYEKGLILDNGIVEDFIYVDVQYRVKEEIVYDFTWENKEVENQKPEYKTFENLGASSAKDFPEPDDDYYKPVVLIKEKPFLPSAFIEQEINSYIRNNKKYIEKEYSEPANDFKINFGLRTQYTNPTINNLISENIFPTEIVKLSDTTTGSFPPIEIVEPSANIELTDSVVKLSNIDLSNVNIFEELKDLEKVDIKNLLLERRDLLYDAWINSAEVTNSNSTRILGTKHFLYSEKNLLGNNEEAKKTNEDLYAMIVENGSAENLTWYDLGKKDPENKINYPNINVEGQVFENGPEEIGDISGFGFSLPAKYQVDSLLNANINKVFPKNKDWFDEDGEFKEAPTLKTGYNQKFYTKNYIYYKEYIPISDYVWLQPEDNIMQVSIRGRSTTAESSSFPNSSVLNQLTIPELPHENFHTIETPIEIDGYYTDEDFIVAIKPKIKEFLEDNKETIRKGRFAYEVLKFYGVARYVGLGYATTAYYVMVDYQYYEKEMVTGYEEKVFGTTVVTETEYTLVEKKDPKIEYHGLTVTIKTDFIYDGGLYDNKLIVYPVTFTKTSDQQNETSITIKDLFDFYYNERSKTFDLKIKNYFFDFNNEPSIDVKIIFKENPDYKKIENSSLGIGFGTEDRLFLVSGNDKEPNIDYYNVSNNLLGDGNIEQSYEHTYFPSKNYRVVGEKTKINGYVVSTDSFLFITKDSNNKNDKLYIRERRINEAGQVVYHEVRTSINKTPINKNAFAKFNNDVVLLDETGLYGIEMAENVQTDERLTRLRSPFINEELKNAIKSVDKEQIFIYEDNELLFIVLGKTIYVADSRYFAKNEDGEVDNLGYEFVKWELNTKINEVKKVGNEIYLTDDNSSLYKLKKEKGYDEKARYINSGINFIKDDTFDVFGFNQAEDFGFALDVFYPSEKDRYTVQVVSEDRIYRKVNTEFTLEGKKLFFNSSDIEKVSDLKTGISVYTFDKDGEILSPNIIAEISETEYCITLLEEVENVDELELYIDDDKIYKIGEYQDGVYKLQKETESDPVILLVPKKAVLAYDIILYERKPIDIEWISAVFDFGNGMFEKTLFKTFVNGAKKSEGAKLEIGYRTQKQETAFEKNIPGLLEFDLFNFGLSSLTTFQEFGLQAPTKKNNFLYIQFKIKASGEIEINQIDFLYKNNRMIKSFG